MTEKQLRLLSFIRNSLIHSSQAPTFQAMRSFMGVVSNQAIEDWLSILEREGYISRTGGARRAIRLTNKGLPGDKPKLNLGKENSPELKTYLGENYTSLPSLGSITSYAVPSQTPQIGTTTNQHNINSFALKNEGWEGTA